MKKLINKLRIGTNNCSKYSANKISKSRVLFTVMFLVALAFGFTNKAKAQARVFGLTSPVLPTGNTYFRILDVDDLNTLHEWVTGTGQTAGGPYTCASIEFVVVADIDFNGVIGDESHPFSGILNGNGATITLNSGSSSQNYVGLFAYLEGATINNLNIAGELEGNSFVGSIAGCANNSTIINSNNNSIVKGNSVVGGIVGMSTNGTIQDCSNKSSISGLGNRVGGIVGYMSGDISSCYNNGFVCGSSGVGGICGEIAGGSITFSSNNFNVRGDFLIGGIVGATWATFINGTVFQCINNGPIEGFSNVGGIVGLFMGGNMILNFNTGSVTSGITFGGC